MYYLTTSEKRQWEEILREIGQYDFYHLPEYHRLHERQGEGEAQLFIFQQDNKIIALPLLVRKIEEVPGLHGFSGVDATSVYGYPGPLANEIAWNDRTFWVQFQNALRQYALANGWISVFSRLHPLLQNHRLLTGLGQITPLSKTIAIDLTLSPAEQIARYRKSHRYEVRRARREGMEVYRDTSWQTYETFMQLYKETMIRVRADDHYFFDKAYFDTLREVLGEHLQLFVARLHGEICAAALFVRTNDVIQYHLSASASDCLKLAPSKLIIDEARQWGNKIGARWLHLGGGVGSQEDDLFRFKAGFSPSRSQFYIWKWVVQPDRYQDLVQARRQWMRERHGDVWSHSAYFPAYRIQP